MTHRKKVVEKVSELNTLFLMLDDKGQESALNVLRSLEFAQSILTDRSPKKSEQTA